jgi:hypothetical protein
MSVMKNSSSESGGPFFFSFENKEKYENYSGADF